MQVMKNIFALSLFLCFCAFSQGVDEVDSLAPWIPRNLPDGIPFSGAVGSRFRISALVKDAIINPGSAFDFEVDIHATGRVLLPPGEFDFESMFAGNSSFKVEILPGLTQTGAKRWRYFCRLWPLEEGKLEIPEIPFAYINPDIPWPNKQLMLDFSDSIKEEVLQRKVFAVSLRGPDIVFNVDGLLKSPWMNSVKGFGLTEYIWMFLTPPFVGIAIWSIAKYRTSMESLNARGRAVWALENLTSLKHKTDLLQAEGVFKLMQEYLHSSFGMSGVVTSAEIVNGLFSKFLNQNETQQFSKFFSVIETLKFNPELSNNACDLIDQAIAWIRILEVRR